MGVRGAWVCTMCGHGFFWLQAGPWWLRWVACSVARLRWAGLLRQLPRWVGARHRLLFFFGWWSLVAVVDGCRVVVGGRWVGCCVARGPLARLFRPAGLRGYACVREGVAHVMIAGALAVLVAVLAGCAVLVC